MYWKEVVASLYAWDLLDEGLDAILDTLERDTLTNSTYLVALMHDEKRPLTDFYYPHNPKRKVYWTEDSRAYWRPNLETYSDCRIQPLVSDRPEIRERDWLQEQHGCDRYLEQMRDWSQQRGRQAGCAFGEGFRQHLGHAYPRDNLLQTALGPLAHIAGRPRA